tara:strand:+ start:17825 stop:18139 length:315 start_codon:yes stop_codon:yes gene_type:complete
LKNPNGNSKDDETRNLLMLITLLQNQIIVTPKNEMHVRSIIMNNEVALINIKEVIKLTNLSESTIRRYAKDKNNPFPEPKVLSIRNVRWSRNDILEWIQNIERS